MSDCWHSFKGIDGETYSVGMNPSGSLWCWFNERTPDEFYRIWRGPIDSVQNLLERMDEKQLDKVHKQVLANVTRH